MTLAVKLFLWSLVVIWVTGPLYITYTNFTYGNCNELGRKFHQKVTRLWICTVKPGALDRNRISPLTCKMTQLSRGQFSTFILEFQYSVNLTFMCTGKPKLCVTHFIALFHLLQQSSTKFAIPLKVYFLLLWIRASIWDHVPSCVFQWPLGYNRM